jgi:hypothetical protein
MSDITKLTNAQEERRARMSVIDGDEVLNYPSDGDPDSYAWNYAWEQGLDQEVAEADARSEFPDESHEEFFARKIREHKEKRAVEVAESDARIEEARAEGEES